MSAKDIVMSAAGASAPSDPYFENVSLLLSGDGTNGAQNNTFLDSSTNNFSITRNGNTTQGTFSPYGNLWSNYFDGTGDSLTCAASASQLSTNDFTVETWVFPTTFAAPHTVVCNGPYNSNGWEIVVNYPATGSVSWYSNGAVIATSGAGYVPLNTWTHIAAVRSGTSLKLFVNGVNVATATNSTNYSAATSTYVGTNDSGETYFGYISNIRIVKGTALYTSNFTPSTTPLTAVSGTSLLTCQSNRFIDNSSNNFTLTVNDNTSVQRFSPFNPTAPYSAATIGGSGYFEGTGDSLSFPTNSAFTLGTNDFTIEGWLYPNALANTNAAFALESSAYPRVLWIHDAGSFRVYASTTGSSWQINQTVTPIVGAYNHVVFQRNGNDFRTFLNGVVVATTTSSLNFGAQRSAGYIGRGDSSSQQWNGYIGDMRITNGTAVYSTSGFTPPTSPLTAITNTSLLCNFTNAGIPDAAMMNDLETIGNAQVSTSVKKYGTGSLYFDGTGDYIVLKDKQIGDFGSGDFTVECWVNPTTASGSIINNYNSLTTTSIAFQFEGAGYVGAYIYQGSTAKGVGSSSAITTGVWTHLAFVRNGTSLALYVNGVLAQSIAVSGAVNTPVLPLSIGAEGGSYFYTGYIDDLRITKGYARYTANFTPPAQALPTN